MNQHVPDTTASLQASLEETRARFLAVVAELRPSLHRFCSRMCGSVLDGEDVVQETLAQAFYYLASLRDESRLEPWLFRIAHHKCVDFLRRERRAREDTVPYEEEHAPIVSPDDDADDEPVSEALAAMVGALPPKERACVLLKDVLGYPLTEIAGMVDTSLGGAKSALHRGRTKLRELQSRPSRAELDREQRALLLAYVERFNERDWDGLRRLIRADATLEVVGATGDSATPVTTYFGNYTKLPWDWRWTLALVDGAPLAVLLRRDGDEWRPHSAVRLTWEDGRVVRIRDYVHVDYLLCDVRTEVLG
ncbi:MAG: polymerase, sigma-24 subunit, subfamily [Gemmatimonadetes bacterium]|nr:polymerase, sigma-24 subunit, subfamily [Gemmatimonadota bacterium]